jgi:hypothetical protein
MNNRDTVSPNVPLPDPNALLPDAPYILSLLNEEIRQRNIEKL